MYPHSYTAVPSTRGCTINVYVRVHIVRVNQFIILYIGFQNETSVVSAKLRDSSNDSHPLGADENIINNSTE